MTQPETAAKILRAASKLFSEKGYANVSVEVGPLPAGWPPGAPYDVILADGGIAELPDAIASQLAEGGRLVAIEARDGRCGSGVLYRKIAGSVSGRALFDAAAPYLPGFAPQPAFAL